MPQQTAKPVVASKNDLLGDLEHPISDIHDMSRIVVDIFYDVFGIDAGVVTVSEDARAKLGFALRHLNDMVVDLHRQYHGE